MIEEKNEYFIIQLIEKFCYRTVIEKKLILVNFLLTERLNSTMLNDALLISHP